MRRIRNKAKCRELAPIGRIAAMNLAALSKAAGISEAYASLILRGMRVPKMNVAARVARALGLTLDELYVRITGDQTQRAA